MLFRPAFSLAAAVLLLFIVGSCGTKAKLSKNSVSAAPATPAKPSAAAANLAANTVGVRFDLITAKPIAATERIYIASNRADMGAWKADGVELVRGVGKGDTIFSAVVRMPLHSAAQFKITRGSWDKEAIYREGELPDNLVLRPVGRDTIVRVRVPAWKDGSDIRRGKITGTLRSEGTIAYAGLLPRRVRVWLPPDYVTENRRYPAVYMHDGQMLFDPPAMSADKNDWHTDEIADSLIRAHAINPIIIVAIDNTSDRFDDYADTEKGRRYTEFIIKKLKPRIDSTYRTLTDARNTAVWGSSMGGICAFRMAWEHPDVFGNAACFSPAFEYKNYSYVPKVKAAESTHKNLNLYIDNGTLDLETVLQPGIDAVMAELRRQNYTFTWVLGTGDTHNERAWARRSPRVLLQFFGTPDRSQKNGTPVR